MASAKDLLGISTSMASIEGYERYISTNSVLNVLILKLLDIAFGAPLIIIFSAGIFQKPPELEA